MSEYLQWHENGIYLVVLITPEKDLRLLHLAPIPFDASQWTESDPSKWYRMVEVQITGENQNDHHGEKNTGTAPASRLKYHSQTDRRNALGREITFILSAPDYVQVEVHYQFFDGCPVIRSYTTVTNLSQDPIGLEHVSSFCLNGLTRKTPHWDHNTFVHVPHNTWMAESQWLRKAPAELGIQNVGGASMHRIHYEATGTWPCSNYLPMGAFENPYTNTMLAWQIETIGSWHWEMGELADSLYLNISGPSEKENHWWKQLSPKASYISVPVAVAIVPVEHDAAWQALTTYRRLTRRDHADFASMPVIFNDYMNCLWGDPTTEKLLPLILAAARTGCEVFCIDAGWYDSGFWWDRVGEWLPSPERFPDGGIQRPLRAIRDAGMIAGLWLEIEVMGIDCTLAREWPDDCFFQRHGKRIIDHSRYQLDFRHPLVREHATRVIDRLVGEWGVGYIKNDYNIQIGPGTDYQADSPGDGLEQHNTAFLRWLDEMQDRYPQLIIEACASGGMRTSHALHSRCSLQSVSDQTDYKKFPSIAVNSLRAITPEQAGVWSYPQGDDDPETIIFNAVNALPARIHQSGPLHTMPEANLALVREAIDYYKSIRSDIPHALPIWPIGVNRICDGWHAVGLKHRNRLHLAVWRTHADADTLVIPLPFMKGSQPRITCGYPAHADTCWIWDAPKGALTIQLPEKNRARMLLMETGCLS